MGSLPCQAKAHIGTTRAVRTTTRGMELLLMSFINVITEQYLSERATSPSPGVLKGTVARRGIP